MGFKINELKYESENKTIRFPSYLIDNIEKAIQGKNITFSKFVICACKYALDNLEEDEKTTSKV